MQSAAVPVRRAGATVSSHGRRRFALVVAALAAWGAFAWLVVRMLSNQPPSAGFDLELLLLGGRRVASGLTPYDPGLIEGHVVEIQSLFYSYPPLVAQAFSLLSGATTTWVLFAWSILSGTLIVATGRLLARRIGSSVPDVEWWLAAAAPFWFPFTVAVLFGNLDAFFPFLYGVLLLAALGVSGSSRSERATIVGAGFALALVAITKLHPASIVLWFAMRGVAEWRKGIRVAGVGLPPSWGVAMVGVGAAALVILVSVVVGGLAPWRDYVAVLSAGTNADLLDSRNLAPAVQVAMLFGLGADSVRILQIIVTALAVIATVASAARIRDPALSLLVATVASFVILPVTWFHYFGMVIPFAVVAVLRSTPDSRRLVASLLGAAFAVGILGLGLPVSWALPVLILMALAMSTRSPVATTGPSA